MARIVGTPLANLPFRQTAIVLWSENLAGFALLATLGDCIHLFGSLVKPFGLCEINFALVVVSIL